MLANFITKHQVQTNPPRARSVCETLIGWYMIAAKRADRSFVLGIRSLAAGDHGAASSDFIAIKKVNRVLLGNFHHHEN